MKNNILLKTSFISFSLLMNTISIPYSYSIEKDISLNIQSLILLKTISYDRSIQSNQINIAVIFDPSSIISINNKEQIIENLRSSKQNIKGKNINITSISSNSIDSAKSADIYYLSKDLNSSSVIRSAKNNKIITWSASSDHVREGNASIAVINKNNRPKLLINIKNLKMEGHELSSQLLKLSEIID